MSQALTKPQDVTPSKPPIDSETFETNHASNSSCETNWTSTWPTNNFCKPQQSNNDMYLIQRHETPTSPHAYVN